MAGKIAWRVDRVPIGTLVPWEHNPRSSDERVQANIVSAWEEFGQAQTIAVGPNNELYDGHQRVKALLARFGPNHEVVVLRSSRPLNEEERRRFTLYMHAAAVGRWDVDKLDDWGDEVFQDVGLDESIIQQTIEALNDFADVLNSDTAKPTSIDEAPDVLPNLRILDPNPKFDNLGKWDIPNLREDALSGVPKPLDTWAGPDVCSDDGRTWWLYNWHSASIVGMPPERTVLAFYVDDKRFEKIWYQPDVYTAKIINTGITVAVTPNFSLWHDEARATHIYNIYRSRWLGRYFQEAGLSVIPDVNFADERSFEFCLVGIPKHPPAISMQFQTVRTSEEIKRAETGLRIALDELKPEQLLVYGYTSARQIVENVNPECEVVFVVNRAAKRRLVMNRKRREVI